MNTNNLAGRVAVVTGGSRGIGYAIAESLVALGCDVAVSARDEAALGEAAGRLRREAGGRGRVVAVAGDVADYAQVEHLMAEAAGRFGGIDVLVNNAGIGAFGEVAALSLDDWHRTIGTNLTGVFHCCRAAIPHLKRRGGGWIINISSLAGKNPFAGGAAYCASKAALNAFSEALMQEVRYDGIRVSYILPGSVRTGFGRSRDDADADWKLSPGDVAEVVVDLVRHDPRSLPSRVEIRPSRPRK